MTVKENIRKTNYSKLENQFLDRWSPVAISKEAVDKEDLETMFEAGRWAPSSYNEQPWHFVYADTEEGLKKLRPVMVDANRKWADNAPVLLIAFTKRRFAKNNKENYSAELDCGSAWMSIALQAYHLGYVTHAMAGFDHDKAYEVTGVDKDEYKAMCMIAIGKLGNPADLPEDLKDRQKLSHRKEQSEIFIKI